MKAEGSMSRSALLALLLLSTAAGAAPGAEDAAPPAVHRPSRTTIADASGRFVVYGPDREENLDALVWIGEVARGIEDLTGLPLPDGGAAPLRVFLSSDPSKPPAIETRYAVEGGALAPRLLIVNAAGIDRETMVGTAASLLLGLHAQGRPPPEERMEKPASVPAWMAAGVARRLIPDLRTRDDETAWREWAAGRGVALEDILSWSESGRTSEVERAFCGVAVQWIAGRPGARDAFAALLADPAARGPRALEAAAGRLRPGSTAAEAEQEWALRLATLGRLPFAWWMTPGERVAALRERLAHPRAAAPPSTPPEVTGDLTPAALIEHRGEPWAIDVARGMRAGVARTALGQDEDFVRVARRYLDVLRPLSRQPAPPALRWFRCETRGQLRLALDLAEDARRAYEARIALRRSHEDEIDEALGPGAESDAPDARAERLMDLDARALDGIDGGAPGGRSRAPAGPPGR